MIFNIKSKITLKIITLMFFFLISCNNKSTEECKTDVRAYEFGREMESWVYLRYF